MRRFDLTSQQGIQVELICATCSSVFPQLRSYYRQRLKLGQEFFYCGRGCTPQKQAGSLPDSIKSDYERGEGMIAIGQRYSTSGLHVREKLLALGVVIRGPADHVKSGLVAHPTKGIGHSEAAKAKLSLATIKQFSDPANRKRHAEITAAQIASGKLSKPSKIEDTIATELDSLGIEYQRQQQLAYWCVDFILATGEVLEVNGTFWHGDPRFYQPDNLKPIQKLNVNRDTQKRTFLKNRGIPLIEIWESDIRANPTNALLAGLKGQP